jgi:hypothetical protein
MDEFFDFNENSILTLGACLLLMPIWACAILALDHWVSADRSASPSEDAR